MTNAALFILFYNIKDIWCLICLQTFMLTLLIPYPVYISSAMILSDLSAASIAR